MNDNALKHYLSDAAKRYPGRKDIEDQDTASNLFKVHQCFHWASYYFVDDRERALKEFDMGMAVLGAIYNNIMVNRPMGEKEE